MKKFLLWMTLVAVVSDYLLHPFYPQFFELRFGVTDPKIVGYYFAAICGVVMVAFPFWAYVAKRIPELQILVYTQCAAGILAIYCSWTTSYLNFWIISLVMIACKGSYLLVYPYLLKIITKEEHPTTIGILSVIVHLGGILGAVIGGITVDFINVSYIFLIMALGDFIQMGMSYYWLHHKKYKASTVVAPSEVSTAKRTGIHTFILHIGLITLILYFSDFLIRPFFVTYWQEITLSQSKLIAGSVYAIPGIVALFALWMNTKRPAKKGFSSIIVAITIGAIGLLLQGIPMASSVLIGRFIYGWAIFQAVVRFDVLLFDLSTPESYATDYSKVHFFQNLGVLLSSFFVGFLVEHLGTQLTFIVAFSGFILTLGGYYFAFRTPLKTLTKELIKT